MTNSYQSQIIDKQRVKSGVREKAEIFTLMPKLGDFFSPAQSNSARKLKLVSESISFLLTGRQ